MCRILYARADEAFDITPLLSDFAAMSKASKEYQGHGWGCAWLDAEGQWQQYHHIQPVWEDDLSAFGETRLLLVHARSAFRDEGIVVENNMPFSDGQSIFIFNGELQGVRIQAEGRIGAEKIYNYIRRFEKEGLTGALEKASKIIRRRTRYVRAMNIVLSDGRESCFATHYGEDPEYFQMHRCDTEAMSLLCSQPLPHWGEWRSVANDTIERL